MNVRNHNVQVQGPIGLSLLDYLVLPSTDPSYRIVPIETSVLWTWEGYSTSWGGSLGYRGGFLGYPISPGINHTLRGIGARGIDICPKRLTHLLAVLVGYVG